jgi:hypothetical protein
VKQLGEWHIDMEEAASLESTNRKRYESIYSP